jgi:hypothetical protein
MSSDGLDARWRELSEEVVTGMAEWRAQHPKATFQEIETALDERLGRLRARMLQDAALASHATDVRETPLDERPRCSKCGTPLTHHSMQKRDLLTHHGHTVTLNRSYAICPACGEACFPLDEELGLLPGLLTPSVLQSITRLGTWMPFARARKELDFFTHVDISEPTLRRHVQAAGAAYVARQEQDGKELERTLAPAPPGPAVQQVSVDGAMVSLVHKEWAEVRTLAVGVVEKPVMEKGEPVVHTREISYFSRLCDADTFGRLATVETHRRGTENAGTVCAVVDGAPWEQGFIDLHCPKAVRILDFGHAAEHVAEAGRVIHGEDTEPLRTWLGQELHMLKHGQPETVVDDLHRLQDRQAVGQSLSDEKRRIIDKQISYLESRYEQIRYAQFLASSYPIGSGMVESGNKLVVEARLKGAGMHWARAKVNPMLGLRNVACSDRWEEAWPQICQQLRTDRRAVQRKKREERRDKRKPVEAAVIIAAEQGASALPQQPVHSSRPTARLDSEAVEERHRPAADHPWRHALIGRARFEPSQAVNHPKS